jgi:methyl-accepting chemotaxis protein
LPTDLGSLKSKQYGGGFGVIAQEIGRLSAVSNDSLINISGILDQMKSSVLEIAEKVRINTKVNQEQTDAIKNMKINILNIKAETDRLNEKNS